VNPVATGTCPVAGWRVLVPRPAERSADLVQALTAAGARPEVVELIGIAEPADTAALDLAVLGLSRGEDAWVAFTSVNAVDAVVGRARALAVDPVIAADTRVAAVGPATARALRAAGLPVDLQPAARGSAAALAAVFPQAAGDQSVLLPRSDLAPDTLPAALAGKGFQVRPVIAYRTVVRPPEPEIARRLAAGDFHAVLFTSPSTVQALQGVTIAPGTAFGAIGAPTRAAATAAGREIAFTAAEPGSRAYVQALLSYARTIQEA
jgi:uroporphyrinogen-III synthase